MHSSGKLLQTSIAASVAIVTGLLAWELSNAVLSAGKLDDGVGYLRIGYPLSVAASLLFGMIWTDRPWRWPAILFATQTFWSLAKMPELPNLFPFFLVFMAVLAVPGVIAAYAGRWLIGLARD